MPTKKSKRDQVRSGLEEASYVVVPASIAGSLFGLFGIGVGMVVFGGRDATALIGTVFMMMAVFVVVTHRLNNLSRREPDAE